MKYWVVVEQSPANYAAYVPALPGCVATGDSPEEVEREIREAIEMHLAGMAEDGDAVVVPAVYARELEVSAPPAAQDKRAG